MDWIDREAWPWEPRYADVGEGRLHYVDVGEGPPVVLSHGTPTWGFEWRHVIRALAPRYRVIVPDHLGFGLSDRPRDAGYRPEDHARRFRRLVDHLGIDRFALVVHDFGGPFALPTALDDPSRVAALVVTNSFLWSLADDPDFRWPARLAGTALFRFLYGRANLSVRVIAPSAWADRAKLTPAIQAQYLAPWPDVDGRQRVLWALAASMTRSTAFFEAQRALLARVAHVPTLLAWGMKDSAFRPTVLARWRTLVPHAEVVELADAGHWPHEEEPDRYAAAVGAFLDQNFAAIRMPSVSTLPA